MRGKGNIEREYFNVRKYLYGIIVFCSAAFFVTRVPSQDHASISHLTWARSRSRLIPSMKQDFQPMIAH